MKTGKTLFAIIFTAAVSLMATATIIAGTPNIAQTLRNTFGLESATVVKALEDTVFYDMPGRTTLLEMHATTQNLLFKNESGGFDVVRTADDRYVKGEEPSWSTENIEACAVKLSDLQTALANGNIDANVIFMNTQPHIMPGYTQAKDNYPLADSNPAEDTMLYYLNGYGVDYIDVRAVLQNSDLEQSDYTYATDTKWTVEASLVTKHALLGKLIDQYDVESSGTYSYNTKTYPNVFLGSLGQAAGSRFTGVEDFIAIIPKGTTTYSYEAQGDEYTSVWGTFDETLFNEETVRFDETYTYGSYSAYLDGGEYYWRKIVNDTPSSDARVLFVHDASSLPLAALLAPDVAEVHMYFPERAPSDYEFDIVSYVQENDIDFVIFQSDLSGYTPFSNGVFSFDLDR